MDVRVCSGSGEEDDGGCFGRVAVPVPPPPLASQRLWFYVLRFRVPGVSSPPPGRLPLYALRDFSLTDNLSSAVRRFLLPSVCKKTYRSAGGTTYTPYLVLAKRSLLDSDSGGVGGVGLGGPLTSVRRSVVAAQGEPSHRGPLTYVGGTKGDGYSTVGLCVLCGPGGKGLGVGGEDDLRSDLLSCDLLTSGCNVYTVGSGTRRCGPMMAESVWYSDGHPWSPSLWL